MYSPTDPGDDDDDQPVGERTMDEPTEGEDRMLPDERDIVHRREEELIDKKKSPLPGSDSKEKRSKWYSLPHKIRAAVRKLHRQWGHLPAAALKSILRAGKAPEEYIAACDSLICNPCLRKRDLSC